MAEDTKERILRVRRDEAIKAVAEATAQASAAVKARNAARKRYNAAVHDLVEYRDELEKGKEPR